MEELNMQENKGEDLGLETKIKQRKDNLRKAIIAYGKNTKFFILFILFLCSSMITIITVSVVLSGASGIDISQESISQIPLGLLYVLQIPSIMIPLIGLYMIYRASKFEDISKLYSAFSLLSIYTHILLGIIVLSGAVVLLAVTMMLMMMQFAVALTLGIIFGIVFFFNFKLLTTITKILSDLMDICDLDYHKVNPKTPNFLRLRNFMIALFIIVLIGQLFTIFNQQAMDNPSSSALITIFGRYHIVTYLVSVFNIVILGYTVYLLNDVDEHISEYESFN